MFVSDNLENKANQSTSYNPPNKNIGETSGYYFRLLYQNKSSVSRLDFYTGTKLLFTSGIMASSRNGKGKKSVSQEELRRLMKEKQKETTGKKKRIESPFAKYPYVFIMRLGDSSRIVSSRHVRCLVYLLALFDFVFHVLILHSVSLCVRPDVDQYLFLGVPCFMPCAASDILKAHGDLACAR